MKSRFYMELNEEYREFQNSPSISPPASLTDQILSFVSQELHPNAWKVFSKLSLIHLLTGVVTLALCPQFGFRVFGEGVGLLNFFMKLGHYGCMAACGAFFVGVSLLVAGFVLRSEELQALRRYKLLQVGALVSLSLGVFIMADAEILLGFGLAWAIGSISGGVAMLEMSWLLRRRLQFA